LHDVLPESISSLRFDHQFENFISMKLFVKRDLDGFFGLFVDNLVQLLTIIALCGGLCGMDTKLLFGIVLPGCAVSILFGNLFYAWQAHRLAKKTGRTDVTALPYGINTPSVLVYIFFIIKPAYDQTGDPVFAWKMGVLACLGSGLIELVGSFFGGLIRKSTPRAALLTTLAGISIGFIAMEFALMIYQKPIIGLLPLALVLIGLFSRVRLPSGIPSGMLAILLGTAIAWGLVLVRMSFPDAPAWMSLGAPDPSAVSSARETIGLLLPKWCWPEIESTVRGMQDWLPFISIVIPMGIFNVIGSLQNVESASAAGDDYPVGVSMGVNGIGTIVAALFGSCFPTTIYIGHPGWKALGARAGYSTMNGIVIVILCLFGLTSVINAVIPLEVGAGIVLWIGIVITAQAFTATPKEHAPAVAFGLFPAIAAWGAVVMMGTVFASNGQTLRELVTPETPVAAAAIDDSVPLEVNATGFPDQPVGVSEKSAVTKAIAVPTPDRTSRKASAFYIHSLLVMERGFIFTCMIWGATCVCIIDRKFFAAGVWIAIAALLTWLGLMHAYQVFNTGDLDFIFRFMEPHAGAFSYRADDLVVAYVLCSAVMFALASFKDLKVQAAH